MTSQHFTTLDKFWEFPKLRPDSWQDCRTFAAQNTNYHFRTTVKHYGFGFFHGLFQFAHFYDIFRPSNKPQLSWDLFLNQGTETFVNIITQPIATTEAKTLSFEKFHFIDEETSTDDVWMILFQRPKQSFPANFSKILYSHTCERLSLTCLPLRWNPRLRHQPLIIYNQKLWPIRPHKVMRLLEMHYTKAFKVEPLAPWLWLFRYFKLIFSYISYS